MDDGLKQRLVGAIVLSAVAVLFVPVLFDQPDTHNVDTTTQIPPRPAIEHEQFSEAKRPEGISPAPAPQEMFVPREEGSPNDEETEPGLAKASPQPSQAKPKGAKVAAAAPDTRPPQQAVAKPVSSRPTNPKPSAAKPAGKAAVLDTEGLPNAWVVQVISSGTEDKAKAIVGQLKAKKFRAYYRSVKTPKGQIYRVFVGPKISRRRAENLKRELDKLLKVDALILRFQP